MKKLAQIFVCCAIIACCSISAKADLLTDLYGVNINDSTSDGNSLFQLFNSYFKLDAETGYASSNDLFNARGIDPTTTWITSGSELVGAFKVAAFGHELTAHDTDGSSLGSIIDIAGTQNLNSASGISNLGGQSIVLPNDVEVNFRLDVSSSPGNHYFTWSSDPTANNQIEGPGRQGDGMIHMVAFDITDVYNSVYGGDFDSVYMMGWEDLHATGGGGHGSADFDYQDFVTIVTNLKPTAETAGTPEPATCLIFAVGGLGLSAVAWRNRRRGSRCAE